MLFYDEYEKYGNIKISHKSVKVEHTKREMKKYTCGK